MPQNDQKGEAVNDVSRSRSASGHSLNRRVVMKATAGLGALAAAGFGLAPSNDGIAVAQEAGGTRARQWTPADQAGTLAAVSAGDWVMFQADFEFFALGASWNGDVGTWPIVEFQLSADGATWGETIQLAAQTEDGGRPTTDGRLFTPLAFSDAVTFVRYRTVDSSGAPGEVVRLSFTYIDPSDGPWDFDIGGQRTFAVAAGSDDTVAPPEVVTRAEWGANEGWRFDSFGEIWPPEYETVSHIIIHHTATANRPADVAGAIRSIYYYHAVDQGWGDIGYNYLVDHNGRIYQGRFGGQNVIGGHAYQFAIGSSGISTIGNFQTVDISDAAKSGLVAITAFVARDLNPKGASDFHEAPNLPVIASHRDVNSTECPGDRLWNDLPELRDLVAATISSGSQDTGNPAGIAVGDLVRIQTDDGAPLNLRSEPNGTVTGSTANGATARVIDGPAILPDNNWYRIESAAGSGWSVAKYMIVDPPAPPLGDADDFPFGLNVRFISETNVRSGPGTSNGVLRTVTRNTWAAILAGPTVADGNDWYQIRTEVGADGWVIKANLAAAPINTSPAARFKVGDTVEATEQLNVRPRPGIAQKVISTAGAGSRFRITQPPIQVTDFIWYGIFNDAVGGGWIVENYIKAVGATPPPATGKFAINDTVRVTEALNLRTGPSTSAGRITTLAAGATGTVVGGPTTADGYTWWQIRTSAGTGWAVENWLEKTGGGTLPPTSGKFAVNDTVRVTEALNLRTGPSTSAGRITTLAAGATGTVVGGPTSADGYTWWQIRTSAGTGWAVENWLEKTSGSTPPPSSGKFAINDTVRVTEALNLRTGPSTSAGRITTLAAGATGTVVGGPTSADGYTWWQIRTSAGTDWAVENWLEKSSGGTPPAGLPAGTVVQVFDGALNLRSGASTSNGVLAVLPDGTRLTIVSGPQSGSGYSWYQVQSATYGTGWVVSNYIRQV